MSIDTPLLPLARQFFEADPARAAQSLDFMKHADALAVLEALPRALSAQAFRHLQAGQAARLLEQVSPELFQAVIERLDSQQCAAILLSLPLASRQKLIDSLPDKERREIQEVLTYPEGSAGRLMTTEFLVLRKDATASEAIERIRAQAQRKAPASYGYIVDAENHLLGVASLYDLIVADPETKVSTVMRRNVFAVNAFMDREEITAELAQRKYFAVPVVDHENRLLGIVKSDRLLAQVQEEATQDLQKMFGASAEERAFSPIGFVLKKRLPWLHVNLATAFLAASVVAVFEGIIAKITILAVFLPVVAGQGGNAGIQTLSVVMRGLVMREIPLHKFWTVLRREAIIGVCNGLATGTVTAAIAWLWYGNPILGVVVGAAIIVNMIAAGVAGAAIPLSMKAIGLDPAQASGIVLTTVTDVVGFFAFLGFAVLLQNHLM